MIIKKIRLTAIKRIHTGYAEHIHSSGTYFSISLLVCKSKWHTLCHVLSLAEWRRKQRLICLNEYS